MSVQIPRFIRRFRGRSAAELRERLEQRLAASAERLGFADRGEPDDVAFRKLLRGNVAAAGIGALVTSVRDRARPHFFAGMRDPSATARFVAERWPARVTEIVRAADEIVGGRFTLLGHPPLSFGDPPHWSLDPVRGVAAPAAHWSTIDYLDPDVAGDHKLVWELSRHQWLVTLGQAWRLTADERYARRAMQLLTSWMDANPPKQGINWASSLEVAYRAIAWTWAHRLLRNSRSMSDAVTVRWLKYLEASGRHVERYLSTWFSPNTHLTGEALGLLYLGTQFPEFRHAPRWKTRGWAILLDRLPHHVRPDGTYYEQATYYHRYTLDIYLHARVLGHAHQLSGVTLIDDALGPLATFLAWVARADGTIPLFGDEDGGRLLFLDGRASDDVRSSVTTVAALLSRTALAGIGGTPSDELAWLLGGDGVSAYDRLPRLEPVDAARAFRDGGIYTIRDGWGSRSAVFTIDCGPLGADNGGHAHADTLAFDLAIGDAHALVDAGTVSYTTSAPERDAMRSSMMHNTVTLDGVSSSEPAGAFRWQEMTAGVLDAWHATTAGVYFEGHHDGYRRLEAPARHSRVVLAARNGWWLLRDVIDGAGSHDAVATFQAAAGLDLSVDGETVRICDDGRLIVAVSSLDSTGAWILDDGVASRRYGARDTARRARFRYRTSGTTAVTYAITRDDSMMVSCERSASGDAIRLVGAEYDDLVLFNWSGHVEEVRTTDARVVWVRRRASDHVVESLLVVGGGVIEIDGAAVADAAGAVTSVTRAPDGWRVVRAGGERPPRDGRDS